MAGHSIFRTYDLEGISPLSFPLIFYPKRTGTISSLIINTIITTTTTTTTTANLTSTIIAPVVLTRSLTMALNTIITIYQTITAPSSLMQIKAAIPIIYSD